MYLDAASDRLNERAQGDFDAAVESGRAAAIFATDQKQYGKWRSRPHRGPGTHAKGLVGDALERAVMGLQAMFPDNVSRATA